MPGKHTEGAFENAIEHGLLAHGWAAGKPSAFDAERAITASDFLAFVKESQPALWEALGKQHGAALDGAVLDALTKALDSLGSLEVLRRGFKFYGKRIDCAYFRPSHGLNPDVLTQYGKNRLVLARQVHFAQSGHADADQSIDMMLSLNGIPVATVELKNQMTGQDVQDAIAQYKRRDARHKLFQFKKRALVHFAVDPDLAYMRDPQRLYQLEAELKAAQVFWLSEVEAFCQVFYAPQAKSSVKDHAAMNRQIDPGIDRFKALDEDAQAAFRNALGAYVRLYAFLSQVVPWSDPELEKLFAFARFFETKLPQDARRAPLRLDGEVALKYYRLDMISEGSILLARDAPMPLKGPTETGTKKQDDPQAKLSEIIEVLNSRFGTEFDESDAPIFDQFVVSAVQDAEVVQQAKANAFENFVLPLKKKLETLMVDRLDDNEKIVTRYLNDPDFQSAVFGWIARRVYDDIRKTAA